MDTIFWVGADISYGFPAIEFSFLIIVENDNLHRKSIRYSYTDTLSNFYVVVFGNLFVYNAFIFIHWIEWPVSA